MWESKASTEGLWCKFNEVLYLIGLLPLTRISHKRWGRRSFCVVCLG